MRPGSLLINMRQKGTEETMADVIIVMVLAVTVFFVVRSQLHKLRSGQCGGGCAGCPESCAGCRDCADPSEEIE